MLDARSIPAKELTPDLVEAWSRRQRAGAEVDSPFFRPEYTLAVAAQRDDVFVAVVEQQGEPVGFLPYQEREQSVN